MTNITILPADVYVVVNKTIINETERKRVSMLYQPIIGYTAVSLYFTLLDDLDKANLMSDDLTHHHLMSTMQLKLEDIVIAREKLEAVGLIKTYLKRDHVNNYVYLIYSPLSASEFLNHPILNVVLYNNLGKKEYDKIVNYYKVPRINLKDFEDITAKFSDVFTTAKGNLFIENDNIRALNNSKITSPDTIDFNLLIEGIPNKMMHEKCFTDEVKGLINNLAYIYKIDNLNMQGLVRNSLNEKGLIDKVELRKRCRNFYQFENGGQLPTLVYSKQPEYLRSPVGDNSKWAKMVYTFENITPYDYLKSKCNGGEVTTRDLKLIEMLLIDMKMKPGVVNVLIAYVLKINNQKLSRNYVETIAGQWMRLHIETVEEAMRISEKEHKKIKKLVDKPKSSVAVKKVEKLPEWFDKEINNVNPSKEEEEELTSILKEFV